MTKPSDDVFMAQGFCKHVRWIDCTLDFLDTQMSLANFLLYPKVFYFQMSDLPKPES